MAEFRDQALGLTLRTVLAVPSDTKAGDDAHKILDQIFLVVLSQIDNFDPATLDLAALKPTESGTVRNAYLLGIYTEFHALLIVQMF